MPRSKSKGKRSKRSLARALLILAAVALAFLTLLSRSGPRGRSASTADIGDVASTSARAVIATASQTSTPPSAVTPTSTVLPQTATAIPATPTSVAVAVATATALSTSTPTSTTPVDPQAVPAQVQQGRVSVIRVRAEHDSKVTGSFEARSLAWERTEEDPNVYWTVLGFAADSTPGLRKVSVSVSDGRGGQEKREIELRVVPTSFPVEQVWLPPDQSDLLAPEVMTTEKQRMVALTSIARAKAFWSGPFILPVSGEISSLFGTRRSYNGGPPSDYHGGTDFDVPEGTPVVASAGGVVVLAEPLAVRGNAVVIDHGMGVFSGYYHMSEISVAKGDAVARGQAVGISGATGMATGPHLHWDVIVAGVNVSGLEWVERSIP